MAKKINEMGDIQSEDLLNIIAKNLSETKQDYKEAEISLYSNEAQ